LVRGFRAELLNQAYKALTAPCRAADPEFGFGSLTQADGSLWRLVTERPMHLLDPRFNDWDEQLLAAVDAVIVTLTSDGSSLAERTWGERNRVAIRHPLSLAVPLLSRFLDMPVTNFRATASRRAPRGRVSAPPSGWRSRPAASRTASSTCRGAERPPALAVLPRRPRRLGEGRADAVPARANSPHADARACA